MRATQCNTFCDTILHPPALLFLARHRLRLSQQENTRPHVALVTLDFLHQHYVDTLQLLSLSLDSSLIENVWAELEKGVGSRPVQPVNLQQLEVAMNQEWQAIPQYVIQHYVQAMHRGCQAVIHAQGGHARYWIVHLNCILAKDI